MNNNLTNQIDTTNQNDTTKNIDIILNDVVNNKYVNLEFNDNIIIPLSISSFLFKYSTYLQYFIEDENEDNIIILCPSSYILDEQNKCYFDDNINLLFLYTLTSDKFINVCRFLDIIVYDNNDDTSEDAATFSEMFIVYVMRHIKENINIIHVFMNKEIRSIMNYINKIDIDIQIKTCTPIFYNLYLCRYIVEVIIYMRYDIYKLNKKRYYKYIDKYDNELTRIELETPEYKNFIFECTPVSGPSNYLYYPNLKHYNSDEIIHIIIH